MALVKILLIPCILFFYFMYMIYGFKFIVLPIINSTLDYVNDRNNHIYYGSIDISLMFLSILYAILMISIPASFFAIIFLIKKKLIF